MLQTTLSPEQVTLLETEINKLTRDELMQVIAEEMPPGVPAVGYPRTDAATIDQAVGFKNQWLPQWKLYLIVHMLFAHLRNGERFAEQFDKSMYARFVNIPAARGVRNTRLMGARTNLPGGPESLVASFLSGIKGKNAAQQSDILKERAGIAGPAPNRKGFSGGRRGKSRRLSRKGRKTTRR
jgi:hypothetical protein